MDSYEILGVSRDYSDKEIEVAFNDLKKKYDPSFNTSMKAYKKYREILKAYENIKNENKRKMYDIKEDFLDRKEENNHYKLYDFTKVKEKEEVVISEELDFSKSIEKEDIVINKDISYLYLLLNLRDDIEYYRLAKCSECKDDVTCDLCEGVGVVYYKEKQVYCPKCYGKGRVSSSCSCCDNLGYYNKKEIISLFVNNEKEERIGFGNEYFDNSKSDLIINYNFYDKENITVLDNEIKIKYYLSKEETFNGINKTFYGEGGAFKLEVDSFVDNGYSKEVLFNNKKIIFSFYNDKVEGENKEYYLLVNKEYRNKVLYFNGDYSECSKDKSEIFFNSLVISDENIVKGFGYKGKYEGNDGDLIVRVKFLNKDIFVYSDNVEIISTSSLFNKLGGSINGFSHYGFKGSDALINKGNRYYLLSGNSNSKMKLKNYFLYKIVCLLVLLLTPCLMLFIPYSEGMFITLIISLVLELVLINVLMEVRV